MPIRDVCSPVNKMKRPAPPLDVHAALRRTNPKHAHPEATGPKAPASSTLVELPIAKQAT
jgi:hypothetical protein